MSCPALWVGAASGVEPDKQRAIAAARGATSRYRERIGTAPCNWGAVLRTVSREFLAGRAVTGREVVVYASRPGRPAVRRRELPAVGSCNGGRPRITGDDGREVQGFGKPHTLPGASIDRANDGAGTADEPTRGRRRRHAGRQSHALVGTVPDRPRSLLRRATVARDGHRRRASERPDPAFESRARRQRGEN